MAPPTRSRLPWALSRIPLSPPSRWLLSRPRLVVRLVPPEPPEPPEFLEPLAFPALRLPVNPLAPPHLISPSDPPELLNPPALRDLRDLRLNNTM